MKRLATDLRRAAPLALLLGAMACGGAGGGGCGPALDADKIAEEAKKGTDGKGGAAGAAAARSKMSDALAAKGDGYKPGAYADALSGFSSTGGSNGTPKGEFARLAQSLPPTPENQRLITQALGQDAARGGPGGSTDLAGNGGYVSIGKSDDGKPVWQWNAYDAQHSAPKGFDKPYSPFKADPGAGDASANASVATTSADPSNTLQSGAPPGYSGCWPKPPGLHHINLNLMGGNGNRRVVDATPIVCSRSYCAAVMRDPNRGCCPLRPEGDPMRVKCEGEVLGKNSQGKIGPRWVYKGNGGVEVQPVNPFLAWAYGNGWVGACSHVSPVCSWKEVINHPENLPGSTTGYAGGGGGGSSGSGGSSSSSSPSSRKGSSSSAAPSTSTNTAPSDNNLESLVPVIPEVAPAVNAP